ncbi:MAG: hypothetical protein AAF320_05315, partial [Myxococcota bacterium]
RALARDVGKAVGVPAHLAGLRRTHSGCYALADALCGSDLSQASVLLQAMLTGVEAVPGLPQVAVCEREANELRHGRSIVSNQEHAQCWQRTQCLAVAHCNNALVALVRQKGDQLFPVRVFAVS